MQRGNIFVLRSQCVALYFLSQAGQCLKALSIFLKPVTTRTGFDSDNHQQHAGWQSSLFIPYTSYMQKTKDLKLYPEGNYFTLLSQSVHLRRL
jgi:hypothetical protein